MTVYELIQKLAEFEPLTEVKVSVNGEQAEFDEYKNCYEEPKMDVSAVPIYVDLPYYDAKFVEVVCELEKL